jgi:hypothetical protein
MTDNLSMFYLFRLETTLNLDEACAEILCACLHTAYAYHISKPQSDNQRKHYVVYHHIIYPVQHANKFDRVWFPSYV